jgi:uncharacterized protein DUF3883
MIRSVGTLYAIQDLFEHLDRHDLDRDQFLTGFPKYGSSTAQDVYETATQLSWICTAASGQLVPTDIGRAAHAGPDRPTKLRFQLAKIIEAQQPGWAGLLPKGRKEAIAGFPSEIYQCFEEALLLGDSTDEIVSWWDRLSGLMRAVSQRALLETGRKGERHSIQYEHRRTNKLPKWQSFETNYAGYDVLSIRAEDDATPLKIEVKASDRTFKYASIYVTEHEWTTATKSPGDYVFHIWLIGPPLALFIIDSTTVMANAPTNQGKGKWRNAEIPLGAITHPSRAILPPQQPASR